MGYSSFRAWAATGVAAALIAGPAAAESGRRSFDIPSQPMAAALEAFGRQSDAEILFSRGEVDGKTSGAVVGRLGPDAALARLLANSGLVVRRPNPSTYVVEPAPPAAAPRPPTPEPLSPPPETAQLQSLIVTAQKRIERLLDVPLAVTAITGQTLDNQGVTGNEQLSRVVPSLSFTELSPGENSLSLRGLTNAYGLFPTVAFYIDETPLDLRQDSKSGTPSIDMFDAARVEVLRGPQGTLFGSGSLGGAVRVILNQPDPARFEARGEVGLDTIDDGGSGHTAKAVVNAPVNDQLAVRIGAASVQYAGFTTIVRPANYYAAAASDPAIQTNANPSDLDSLRVAAAWLPDGGWTVTPSLYLQRLTAHGYNQSDSNRPDYDYSRGFQETNTDDLMIGALTVKKQFEHVELLFSSSYTDKNQNSFEDYSAWVARRYAALTAQTAQIPYFPTINYQTNVYYQYSDEVRLSSDQSAPLSWIAGVYLSSVKQKERQAITSPTYARFYAGLIGAPYSPTLLDYHGPTLDRQAAGFVDITYRASDLVEVSVGGRLYTLKQRHQVTQSGLLSGADAAPSFGGQTGINPRVNIKLKPADDASVYISASKGFRPGGANTSLFGAPLPSCTYQNLYSGDYQPDSVWNYETGAKIQLLDRKLGLNAAAYQIDWDNIQGSLLSTCGSFITNLGAARIRGAEIELYWRPTPALSLNASGSFNQAVFTSLKPGVAPALSISTGGRLINTPREKWALQADYALRGPFGLASYVRTALQHVGSTPTSYTNVAPIFYKPAYTNLDAAAGVRVYGTAFEIYVDNVLNSFEVLGVNNSQLQTYPVRSVFPPRTFGVSIKRPF